MLVIKQSTKLKLNQIDLNLPLVLTTQVMTTRVMTSSQGLKPGGGGGGGDGDNLKMQSDVRAGTCHNP